MKYYVSKWYYLGRSIQPIMFFIFLLISIVRGNDLSEIIMFALIFFSLFSISTYGLYIQSKTPIIETNDNEIIINDAWPSKEVVHWRHLTDLNKGFFGYKLSVLGKTIRLPLDSISKSDRESVLLVINKYVPK